MSLPTVQEPTDIAGHKAEAELTLFAALGVFTGSSGLGGAVKPDDPITRAEFWRKVVVLAIGRGATAACSSAPSRATRLSRRRSVAV